MTMWINDRGFTYTKRLVMDTKEGQPTYITIIYTLMNIFGTIIEMLELILRHKKT